MVRVQRGWRRRVRFARFSTDRDRIHERHSQVHQLAVQIPALREPARNLRRYQRLSRRFAARRFDII